MARILVTDGEQRAALALTRSLGRAGHQVIVTSESGTSLTGASRHALRELRVPSALADPMAYATGVEEIVRDLDIGVVIPVTEPAVLALLPRRSGLAPAVVPLPPLGAFLQASDKVHVSRAAAGAGICIPRQVVVMSRADAKGLPAWTSEGVVLKPGRSVNAGRKLSVSYVPAGTAAETAIATLPDAAFPLLIQQRIHGPGTGVFLLRWEDTTLAAFAHRRIREKPPSGGVSVVRESVALPDDLRSRSERLLDLLAWRGVAMLEFKLSADTGTPYLMEINGRFWGSLQLAIDSGVDFPSLLVAAALGDTPTPVLNFKHGVRSRWLLGDVDHLLARMRKSREVLNLPPNAAGPGRVVAEFIRDFLPPNRFEVLRWNDPKPFWRELRLWLHQLRAGA